MADDRRRPGTPDRRGGVPDQQAAAAHELLDSGEVAGKVLLRVGD